jgi:hypothetical protein
MARKPNKMKAERRSTTKSKAKRSGSKPLMAEPASVRTAKPSASMSRAPNGNGKRPTSPFNPALTVAAMIGPHDGCLCRVACPALAMSVSHEYLV